MLELHRVGRVRAKDVSDDWERELQYNPSILDTRVVLPFQHAAYRNTQSSCA